MEGTLELGKAFLQFTFFFGVVLALAWVTTRFVGLRMGLPMQGASMRTLQHIPAGRDRSIMLLEVGGRLYLLGVTAEQINLLDAIDDPDAIRRILDTPADLERRMGGPALSRSFREMLDKVIRRSAPPMNSVGPSAVQPESDQDTERLREQIERLRRLQNKE